MSVSQRGPLTIAVPAGRLYAETVQTLERCGLDPTAWRGDERRLLWSSPDGEWRFLVARPADVTTYVEEGVADVGVTGKDSLMDLDGDVYELLDLGFGRCRLVLAAPVGFTIAGDRPFRVATKYPRFALRRLAEMGLEARVIVLHGASELAAVSGLADAIVDATETGATLRNNGLVPRLELASSSARLICNRAAFQLRRDDVTALIRRIREVSAGSGEKEGVTSLGR